MNRPYHHGDLKQTLVDTLYELVESEPLERLTVRFLTERLGVSRTAIYRHYPSKEALFAAVVQKGFDALEAALAEATVETDPRRRLYALGAAYLAFALRFPKHYRLMMNDQWRVYRELGCSEATAERESGGFELVKAACEAAQQASVLKPGDASTQATIIWSLVHGMASLTIDGHLEEAQLMPLYDAAFEQYCSGMCRNP